MTMDIEVDASTVTLGGMSMVTPRGSNEEEQTTESTGESVNLSPPGKASEPYAFIDPETRTCTSCGDREAIKTVLTCTFCQINFHGVCRTILGDKTGDNVICPISFYKQFTLAHAKEGKYAKRAGNFLFACDACQTARELKQTANEDDKVDLIDRRVSKLAQSMDEMKSKLENIAATNANEKVDCYISNERRKSYANAAATSDPATQAPEVQRKRSVLVVNGNSKHNLQNSEDLDKLITSNAIHVESTYIKENGSAVFTCSTQRDREKLNKTLSENYPSVEIIQSPDLLPTISVSNLVTEYSKKELNDIILQQHTEIQEFVDQGEVFSVLAVRQQRTNKTRYHATIRVGNKIRKFIGNRLFIVKIRVPVYDHFHVKRCNKCQRFGHYEDNCKATQLTCEHCSESHSSKSCPRLGKEKFIPCCNNCQNNKFSGVKNSHNAFSISCPSYKAEQEKLKKKIYYFNSKN